MSERPEEWDERQLCPDESCIGVLGRDLRCPVCGRTGKGMPASDPGEVEDGLDDDLDDDGEVDEDEDEDERDEVDGDDDDRQLCPDGSCIGLIGDDGRCKVCGTSGTR